ncbi:MAG: redoxin domain-containing protein [Deltaproteobacteria bacterium]|nr:redoxin domain-containing protein [Deltaproteobacteria bacterium]
MNQEIGKRFPDLELPDQDNNRVKLSAISNGQPVMVSFYRGYW